MNLVLTATLAVAAVLLIVFVLVNYVRFWARQRRVAHVPGPAPCFPFGNVLLVWRALRERRTATDVLTKLRDEYGPIFRFSLLGTPLVVITEPSAVAEVLVRTSLPKSGFYEKLPRGLLTLQANDEWAHRRRAFTPFFHRQFHEAFLGHMRDLFVVFGEHLAAFAAAKQTVPFLEECSAFTLDVIGRAGFGIDFHTLEDPRGRLPQLVTAWLNTLDEGFRNLLGPLNLSLTYRIHRLRAQFADILERLRSDRAGQTARQDDLLDVILAYRDLKGQPLKRDELANEFMTFLIAGHETSSNTIAYTLYELLRSPEDMRAVRAEADEVWHDVRSLGDLRALPSIGEQSRIQPLRYTHAAIEEALRLHAVAPGTMREAVDDMQIGPYLLPKGTFLEVEFTALSCSPANCPDPLAYRPQRMLNNEMPPNSFMPFSTGVRNCIGKQFALLETKLAVSLLARLFEFAPAWTPDNEPYSIERITQRLSHMPVTVRQRDL